MAFTLPELPYSKDALQPHMSAETFDYHCGKHHKAYVDKTNGMLGEKGLEGASLLEVIKCGDRQGRQAAVQQLRADLEPQLLLAMPCARRARPPVGPARRN